MAGKGEFIVRRAKYKTVSEDLARRMTALEEQAFQEFFDIFAPRFRAFFISKGMTRADAEELAISCASDVALKVDKYRAMEGFSFEAWVFTLARHARSDWADKQKPEAPFIDEFMAERLWARPIEEPPEPNADIILSVREAMAQLPERDRKIVQLRAESSEISFKEIGQELEMREGTVRVRYHRAIQKLKSRLEQDARVQPIIRRIILSEDH